MGDVLPPSCTCLIYPATWTTESGICCFLPISCKKIQRDIVNIMTVLMSSFFLCSYFYFFTFCCIVCSELAFICFPNTINSTEISTFLSGVLQLLWWIRYKFPQGSYVGTLWNLYGGGTHQEDWVTRDRSLKDVSWEFPSSFSSSCFTTRSVPEIAPVIGMSPAMKSSVEAKWGCPILNLRLPQKLAKHILLYQWKMDQYTSQ